MRTLDCRFKNGARTNGKYTSPCINWMFQNGVRLRGPRMEAKAFGINWRSKRGERGF